MSVVPSLADQIRRCGARATPARVRVLSLLREAPTPLSHAEIEARLGELAIDRVTLYRVLDWLVEVGIAHRVNAADRILRFSISPQPHCHAHFQCERCGRVFCLPEAVPPLPESLPAGFLLHEVEMTVKGMCADCAR